MTRSSTSAPTARRPGRPDRRARRADRRGGPDRGAVRHPDRPDGRHRGDHPGRAGPDHPLTAQRGDRRPGRAGHRQDRGGPAPGRLPAVHLPRAAVPAGRADRRPEPDVPPLHRARAALAGRDRGADVHHQRPVPGDQRPPRPKPPETAEIKGRARPWPGCWPPRCGTGRQLPAEPLEITFEREVLRLDRKTVQQARERARRSRRPHNQARPIFVREIIERPGPAGHQQVHGRPAGDRQDGRRDPRRGGRRPRTAPCWARRTPRTSAPSCARTPQVRAAIAQLWPVLTPQRLLDDLFASPRRLAAAAPRLAAAERDLLRRDPGGGWTPADVPLLDEAAELLGDDDRAARQRARRGAPAAGRLRPGRAGHRLP